MANKLLCTSHRQVRAQHFDQPGLLAHFRVFALCTANRPRVSLTASPDEILHEKLRAEVIEPLSSGFLGTRLDLDEGLTAEDGYYERLSFKLHAESQQGTEYELAAGGFTDWTRKLLSNRKERLLISGIGTEMVCVVLRR